MTIEIVGSPVDIKYYRKYLQERAIATKQFLDHMKMQGHSIAPKPDNFRVFKSQINSFYSEDKITGTHVKKLDPDQRLFIQGIANANIIDRTEERLEPAGIDVRNFMLNPVLLLDHLYVSMSTVGRVLRLDPQSDGVHFDGFVGDPTKADLTKTQIDIRSLIAQGLLQTVSVGFIPHKIQAPEFNSKGELENPAVILIWELLELSIVAVPANPGSIFDIGVLSIDDNGKNLLQIPHFYSIKQDGAVNDNKQDDDESTALERIIFKKEDYTLEQAKEYAKASEYKFSDIEDGDGEFAFIQRLKEDFIDGSLKNIELNDGLRGVVGKLKTEIVEEARKLAKEDQILDEMKRFSTIATTNGESLRKIIEQNEKIIQNTLVEEKKVKEENDEDEKKPMVDEEKPSNKEEEEDDMNNEEEKKEEEKGAQDIEEVKEMVKSLSEKVSQLTELTVHLIEETGIMSGE